MLQIDKSSFFKLNFKLIMKGCFFRLFCGAALVLLIFYLVTKNSDSIKEGLDKSKVYIDTMGKAVKYKN